jgi:type I restriction enzyme S subunit
LVGTGILDKPIDGNHGETHPKKADFVDIGVPFIMASDIKDGIVDTKNCSFLSKTQADSLRKGFAKDGDVLLSHKATIGRTAILKTDLDYVMLTPQVTYYRVLDNQTLINEYVYWYFNNPTFLNEMNEYAGVGSTRAYIGITKQRKLKFTYPEIGKQKVIVSKLKLMSKELADLEPIYKAKLLAIDELKTSILQKAFNGKLTVSGK